VEASSLQEDILSLLRSKSRCLRRLLEAGAKFLAVSDDQLIETDQTKKNDVTLNVYDSEREGIMNALSLYDRKLTDMIQALDPNQRAGNWIEQARAEMVVNEALVLSVLEMDDAVMKKITQAQTKISQKLAENRQSREKVAKFKSTWISDHGDEVDTTL
jgi:hypothetical protein